MLALDQRESMRDLLSGSSDDDLRRFKTAAANTLAPHVSAILLDRLYGVDGRPAWAGSVPLILAADHFDQPPGRPVASSTLDPHVTPALVADVGASALKFLQLWSRDDDPAQRLDLAASFVALAAECGVPAVLEGIVRPGSGGWRDPRDRDEAIIEAAAELTQAGPDLYKAEVPGDAAQPETVVAASREVTRASRCPWVILSNGVEPDRFPDAVEAAALGGASGFLAGRAVWTAAARSADPAAALATDSVARVRSMTERLEAGLQAADAERRTSA
ncbi:hypothetical protein [Occultella gossypii]|uniref:Aldolase n=1 Tax=Occultella gossypii TaxID=2800820 RepID=A0ABS7SDY4_9MICO|nr:hypothetical protein [Occultella gossypii]MBZ2197965.1 hypothetical protein [Occultella gossypii]